MKKTCIKILSFAAVLMLFHSISFSQTNKVYKLNLMSGSIQISGVSTLHEYETTNTSIFLDASLETKSDLGAGGKLVNETMNSNVLILDIQKFILQMRVKDFHSGIPGFDGEFDKEFKYKKNPDITFIISKGVQLTVLPNKEQSNRFVIKTSGALYIAGKEKMIPIEASAVATDRYMMVSGSKDLLMTDFGISPPRFLEIFKAKDKVTVSWKLFISFEPVT